MIESAVVGGRERRVAVEASLRGYTDARPDRRPRVSKNALVRALGAEHPEWTEPPGEDSLLRWRYWQAEGAVGMRAMPLSNVRVQFSAMAGDDSFIRRGVVRCDRYKDGEREGAGSRLRRVDGYLAVLPAADRLVLWLAYGPTDYHVQVKARFGRWCGVALVTESAKTGARDAGVVSVGGWLLAGAKAEAVDRVRDEAEALVYGSWNRWADARGRQSRLADPEDAAALLDEREREEGR